jgi:glycosyltransferase involved in cell wall biosynthesis
MAQLPKNLLNLAKHFVLLLREDIRIATNNQGITSNAFSEWWLLRGRAEYPGWAKLSESDQEFLSETIGSMTLNELTLPLPRALSLVIKYRPDVIKQFTKNKRTDQIAVAAWFYAFGIEEMLLHDIILPETLSLLDRPILPPSGLNSDVPAASLLMRLSWQLLSQELRDSMPLENDKARARYIAWFFSNASKHFKLNQLISNRWRQWLKQEVNLAKGVTLPRFVTQELSISKDLSERFNINTTEGAQKLKEWSTRVQRKDGHWSWLNTKHEAVANPKQSPLAFGVNLYGFAFGELGIGEDLRMAVSACESAGIPYRVINVDVGDGASQADHALKTHVEKASQEAPYAINIFCLPGFDTVSRIFLQWGADHFKNHYNIGWWPWELSVWPAAWKGAFSLMDEIWAGSTFSRQMYQQSTALPTELMPLPVSVDRGQTLRRSGFNLPKHAFLFLFVFDFNSHLARKNPQATIEAFNLAFRKNDHQVGLVLKVMNAKQDNPEWQTFLASCSQDRRIHLIHETLDRPDVLGLIDCCDAYISLHRCEGFGRTLAEAICYGKPVIATNYSGNADFMAEGLSYPVDFTLVPLSKGEYHFIEDVDQAVWAEPIISHAANQMRKAMHDTKDKGLKGRIKDHAKAKFSATRIGQLMIARLEKIYVQQTK